MLHYLSALKRLGVDDRSQKLKEQAELSQVTELQEHIEELELEIENLKNRNILANEKINLQILDIEELTMNCKNKEIEINELKLAHEELEYKSELKINSYRNEIEILNLEKKKENLENEHKSYSNTAIIKNDEIIFDNISSIPMTPHIEVQNLQNIFPSEPPPASLDLTKTIIQNDTSMIILSTDDRTNSRRGSVSMSGSKKGISSGKSVLLQQVCRKYVRLLSSLFVRSCSIIF